MFPKKQSSRKSSSGAGGLAGLLSGASGASGSASPSGSRSSSGSGVRRCVLLHKNIDFIYLINILVSGDQLQEHLQVPAVDSALDFKMTQLDFKCMYLLLSSLTYISLIPSSFLLSSFFYFNISGPTVALVLSLSFIGFVILLHIWGK